MYKKARSQVRSHRCSEFGLIEDLFEGNESLVAGQVTSLAEGLLNFPSGENGIVGRHRARKARWMEAVGAELSMWPRNQGVG